MIVDDDNDNYAPPVRAIDHVRIGKSGAGFREKPNAPADGIIPRPNRVDGCSINPWQGTGQEKLMVMINTINHEENYSFSDPVSGGRLNREVEIKPNLNKRESASMLGRQVFEYRPGCKAVLRTQDNDE